MTDEVTTTTDTATADKAAATETVKTETIVTADTKTADTKTSTETTVKPDWPDDWRDKLAGGDKDYRKQLDRYGSPADIGKKARELEKKLSSGEYKRDLPKDADAETVKAWRAERGLPENPEGYVEKLALPNGLVLGEADKPVVAEFAAAAHASNMDQAAFSGLVAKYYEMQDKQAAARAEADAGHQAENIHALRAEWGANYTREINGVNAFVGQIFGKDAASILAARTPDGKLVGDTIGFIKAVAALNREINPVSTLIPSMGNDPAKSISDRKAELMDIRRKTPEKYFGKLEQEFLELIAAEDKLKSRAA